jgi:hypothetical protein
MAMNIAVAFHAGDKDQVARWLSWVEELGGIGRHKLWLLPAKGQLADFRTSIPFEVLEDQYGVNTDWSAHNGPVRDAAGANSMIRQFCWHFFLAKLGPWMFCEPDAIPLRATAFDELEDEYRSAGKAFMGALVPGKEGDYPDHATGNAIYPENALAMSKLLMLPTYAEFEGQRVELALDSVTAPEIPANFHETKLIQHVFRGPRRVELAFDIVAAPDILANFHETKLIQHVFRGAEFTKMDDLARLNPAACIFHTDKTGGLIRLLRERKNENSAPKTQQAPTKETVQVATAGEGVKDEVQAAIKPKAHTYFRPCADPEALAEQKRILAIWEKNWRDAGWEPVILTEEHARKHPQFEKYRKAFEAMPTVSPKEYEMAAWLRHLAMSALGKGIHLLVDYDVLVNDLDEADLFNMHGLENRFPMILSDNNPVPCAVLGHACQFDNAIRAFPDCPVGEEQGRPHLSDMLAVQMLKFPAMDVCREFGTPEWFKAKLIHFSHRACGKMKRSERMALQWNGEITVPLPDFDDFPKPVIECRNPSVSDCIEQLVFHSKRDAFAMARIRKQLRAAGLLPKKLFTKK